MSNTVSIRNKAFKLNTSHIQRNGTRNKDSKGGDQSVSSDDKESKFMKLHHVQICVVHRLF